MTEEQVQSSNPNWGVLSAEEREAVVAGEAALTRLSDRGRVVADWLCLGRALAILRSAAMRASNSNAPRGRHYADAYGKLLPA